MATAIQVPQSTNTRRLDEVVSRLNAGAKGWARAPIDERLAVARMMLDGIVRIADRQVAAACAAKDLKPGSPQEGEEWIGGLVPTVRVLRLTIQALEQIQAHGTTKVGPISRTVDGRLNVRLSPLNAMDKVLVGALTAEAHILAGIDEATFDRDRAGFYKKPDHT
ncbi:MAG TPA: aldehyde dehydrogenase, partial [bacterium]|nr:aldehyde dehydrogenase [bacterium]